MAMKPRSMKRGSGMKKMTMKMTATKKVAKKPKKKMRK